ncbi:MAG: MBL fold metallo-hydrolase [Eubacteriales bacterium]|nr:MBL fold metallo-hydrolase [Eubacteriales bacterium]
MQWKVCPLFSGSKGNATLVQAGDTAVLVDAGVSARRLEGALKQQGVEPGQLRAVLVTHEHSDHISGLNIFAERYALKVYANEQTWKAMNGQMNRLTAVQRIVVEPDTDFFIGGLNVETYATPHDSACSQGYGFYAGGRRAAVVTDLGHMPKGLLERLCGCETLVLECNHDEEMLREGPYPAYLKTRILGRNGHLSNAACGNALRVLINRGARQIALAHLSQENNTPLLARQTVDHILAADDILPGRDIRMLTGRQDEAAGILTME